MESEITDERSGARARRQHAISELVRAALAGASLDGLLAQSRTALSEISDAAVRLAAHDARIHAPAQAERAGDPHGLLRRELRASGRVIGMVEVLADEGRAFAPEDVAFVDGVVNVLTLAAERLALEEQLRRSDRHDALTGLPNRALLEERLNAAMARAARSGSSVAVLFVDLDRFRQINQRLGHHAGNEVLVEIGRRLRREIEGVETVARLGGDEFAVVYEDTDGSGTEALAARVQRILARPITVAGRALTVRATVGISVFPRDATEVSTLLGYSDWAMHHGKRSGRNTILSFGTLDASAPPQYCLEDDFEAALFGGGLELHFQPQVSARSGAIRGLEALTRWEHPEYGSIPPVRFVGLAEELGLSGDFGAWALTEACRQAAPWVDNGLRRVAVNVSPAHIARAGFVETVNRALEEGGLKPEHLELEVTESVMVHDTARVIGPLQELRVAGVAVALDDFGLGYSSFSSLGSLPLDRLKVDRSLVDTRNRQSGSPESQRAVLLGIVTLGRALGIPVTLEGVETEAELDLARSVGCDELQGFLLGGPLPGAEFEHLLPRPAQLRR
jgi:diguanylate cyclase (GGDEF)-like protein